MSDSQAPERITAVMTVPPSLVNRGPAAQKQGTLMVLVGTQMGAAFPLNAQATLIGRNPRAHITLDDEGVSRSQARILHHDGCYEIEDMRSTNGTYLDGVRVEGLMPLQDGARIQMGNAVLRFAMQDALEWEATKRVYEASVRDPLTGAFNRRYFEERLIGEFAFAVRHGTSLCVLLFDIDHFKKINDRWGHPAGDLVLRRIGAELRAAVRAEDVVARYGGEEFIVLARGIDPAGARAFAERMRSLLARAQIQWEQVLIPVTTSVGVSHNHSGAAVSDAQRLVASADKALYAAKAAGRNRVETAQSPGRYTLAQPDGPPPTRTATGPKQQALTAAGTKAPSDKQSAAAELPLLPFPPKTSKLK
jgi:two-component system, cell cycle response regulator